MHMRSQMQDGMAEATRLTREGRLAEAIAVIQSTLGGRFTLPASPETYSSTGATIETTSRVSDEAPTRVPSHPGPTRHALRRVPRRSERWRGILHLPASPSGASSGAAASVPAGGRFFERSYTNKAGTRVYKLYIPGGYVGQEVPLLVMLHGCTQGPDDLAAGTRMNVLAEEHTFLVAYPAQASGANSSRCWNWFQTSDQRRGGGEPSIIAGITREILGEYSVDPGQVYVAGMSAGGAMAAIMAETYPDLYAAVGVHSGLAPGSAHDLSSAFAAMQRGGEITASQGISNGKCARTVPMIVFHGDRDRTVHPRNADRLLAHHLTAASGHNKVAQPMKVRTGRVPEGYAYTHSTHHDAEGHFIVERWIIHGLGHAWSGGSLSGSYTDPKGPDASAQMVRFFRQHPREEPVER